MLFLALILAASAEGVIRPLPPYVGLPTQDGLTRLFFNSRVTRRDPKTSVSCFAGYIGESNLIAEQYSGAYSECLQQAHSSRRGIDKDFLATRRRIEQSAESVCGTLRVCSKINGTLDSFNCHAAAVSSVPFHFPFLVLNCNLHLGFQQHHLHVRHLGKCLGVGYAVAGTLSPDRFAS